MKNEKSVRLLEKNIRLLFFLKNIEVKLNDIIHATEILRSQIWYRSDGEIEMIFSESDFRNKVAPKLTAEELLNMKLERC